jgi:regulator of replication initiation timing
VDSQKLGELERTIEQQYILIGEMDTEQAKLMLENTRLREQLLQE